MVTLQRAGDAGTEPADSGQDDGGRLRRLLQGTRQVTGPGCGTARVLVLVTRFQPSNYVKFIWRKNPTSSSKRLICKQPLY